MLKALRQWRREGIPVLAFALLIASLAGCGLSAGPRFEPPETADEAIAQAREAAEDVESYRYTVHATVNEHDARADGVWAAPDDFTLESDAFGFLVLEYVSVDGRLFQREVGAEESWQEYQWHRSLLTVAPPVSLVGDDDGWELVPPEAASEEAGEYHLRGEAHTEEPHPLLGADSLHTGESFEALLTHDIVLSSQTMLPLRRETHVLNRLIDAEGETDLEWTETWSYEFSDYNAPVSIDLPEPREELPDPNSPPPSPTPASQSQR